MDARVGSILTQRALARNLEINGEEDRA